jgi:hypothetical protein
MPKVWIANYAGHPYDEAEKFGELRYITRGYVSLGNLDRLVYDVTEKVGETDVEDYLLLSGLCIIGVVAAVAWTTRWGGVKILHWDKKESDYQVLAISRGQLEKMFDVFLIREAEDKWRAQASE